MLCELLIIGNESFKILEKEDGYFIKSFTSGKTVTECESEALNETIYRMIERLEA